MLVFLGYSTVVACRAWCCQWLRWTLFTVLYICLSVAGQASARTDENRNAEMSQLIC